MSGDFGNNPESWPDSELGFPQKFLPLYQQWLAHKNATGGTKPVDPAAVIAAAAASGHVDTTTWAALGLGQVNKGPPAPQKDMKFNQNDPSRVFAQQQSGSPLAWRRGQEPPPAGLKSQMTDVLSSMPHLSNMPKKTTVLSTEKNKWSVSDSVNNNVNQIPLLLTGGTQKKQWWNKANKTNVTKTVPVPVPAAATSYSGSGSYGSTPYNDWSSQNMSSLHLDGSSCREVFFKLPVRVENISVEAHLQPSHTGARISMSLWEKVKTPLMPCKEDATAQAVQTAFPVRVRGKTNLTVYMEGVNISIVNAMVFEGQTPVESLVLGIDVMQASGIIWDIATLQITALAGRVPPRELLITERLTACPPTKDMLSLAYGPVQEPWNNPSRGGSNWATHHRYHDRDRSPNSWRRSLSRDSSPSRFDRTSFSDRHRDSSPDFSSSRDRTFSPVGRRGRSPIPRRDRSPLSSRRDRSPLSQRGRSPLPFGRRDRSPALSRRDRSPLPSRRDRSPAPNRRDRSPASSRRDRSPAPNRRDRSPVSNRRDRSPVQSKQDRNVSTDRRDRDSSGRQDRSSVSSRRSKSPISRSVKKDSSQRSSSRTTERSRSSQSGGRDRNSSRSSPKKGSSPSAKSQSSTSQPERSTSHSQNRNSAIRKEKTSPERKSNISSSRNNPDNNTDDKSSKTSHTSSSSNSKTNSQRNTSRYQGSNLQTITPDSTDAKNSSSNVKAEKTSEKPDTEKTVSKIKSDPGSKSAQSKPNISSQSKLKDIKSEVPDAVSGTKTTTAKVAIKRKRPTPQHSIHKCKKASIQPSAKAKKGPVTKIVDDSGNVKTEPQSEASEEPSSSNKTEAVEQEQENDDALALSSDEDDKPNDNNKDHLAELELEDISASESEHQNVDQELEDVSSVSNSEMLDDVSDTELPNSDTELIEQEDVEDDHEEAEEQTEHEEADDQEQVDAEDDVNPKAEEDNAAPKEVVAEEDAQAGEEDEEAEQLTTVDEAVGEDENEDQEPVKEKEDEDESLVLVHAEEDEVEQPEDDNPEAQIEDEEDPESSNQLVDECAEELAQTAQCSEQENVLDSSEISELDKSDVPEGDAKPSSTLPTKPRTKRVIKTRSGKKTVVVKEKSAGKVPEGDVIVSNTEEQDESVDTEQQDTNKLESSGQGTTTKTTPKKVVKVVKKKTASPKVVKKRVVRTRVVKKK